MFNLKFAHTYDNKIFEDYKLKPVVEDYFVIDNSCFCIADGVTRDSINGESIPYPKCEEEARKWVEVYPKHSGAFDAAKICGDNFVKNISGYNKEEINEVIIRKEINRVNEDIWEINKNREIDYLKEDLYCCVAVGGCIVDNKLYCFSIGDCHITTLDKDFNLTFTTINNHKNFENYLNDIYIKENEYDWTTPKDRAMVRRDYRNKPNMKYKGNEVSFGVLSGEKEAEHYIDVYKVNLDNVKYICAYSDGCEPFFESKESIKNTVLNPKNIENKGCERTLIIFENED